MNEPCFTFWEGAMPDYIKLCMDTWQFQFIILNYENVRQYTTELPEKLKQLTLPKIADYVRVHILRDNGGYWLDADTIMLANELPSENILGYPSTRGHTIGFLHTAPDQDMYIKWAGYQDFIIEKLPSMCNDTTPWNIMGNAFTDTYIKEHKDISVGNIEPMWAETYMIHDNIPRNEKYVRFYFEKSYQLNDLLKPTNMLMLHNSWTPEWYKRLNRAELLNKKCTLSNILKLVTER